MELKTVEVSKHSELASLLKVDVNKLQPLAEKTCSRLINAITKNDYFVKQYGLSFFSLRRTQNVGVKSATELCRCLGIPTNLSAMRTPYREAVHHNTQDIADALAKIIHDQSDSKKVIRHVLHAVGSPDLVVTNSDGERFKVSVEKL